MNTNQIEELCQFLNNNCQYKNKNSEYYESFEWIPGNFNNDGNIKIENQWCSEFYQNGKYKDSDNVDFVLCENCSMILRICEFHINHLNVIPLLKILEKKS